MTWKFLMVINLFCIYVKNCRLKERETFFYMVVYLKNYKLRTHTQMNYQLRGQFIFHWLWL